MIGKSTDESIKSGAIYGFAGMITNIVKKMQQELSQNTKVIATGGIANSVVSQVDVIDTFDFNLTLNGLLILYQKNHSDG